MLDLDPILASAIGAIWTSGRMDADLAELCSFGNRFAGSEGEQRAKALVIDRLREAGLQSIHTWGFDYIGWVRGDCRLEAVSPNQVSYPAVSLVGSPSTGPEGLEAEVVDLGMGSLDDFRRLRDQIPGKVVMVNGISRSGAGPVHRRAKYGWAVEHGAVGFILINHLTGMLPLTGSLRSGRPGEIPAVSLSYEDGMALLRATNGPATRVRITVRNESRSARAEHVFADIPGQTDELVILSAHYDGHDISPSALDNGSGLVVALELARTLASYAGKFRRTLRVACWAVEEWGLVGSTKYVESLSQDSVDRIALVVNLDTTSGLGSLRWIVNGFDDLGWLFRRYAVQMGYDYAVGDEVLTNSDHFPFFLRGVPAVWLQGAAPAETTQRRYVLTPADTLDKVSLREMKEAAMVACQVLVRAAAEPNPLARHRRLPEVQMMLRRQGLEAALKAQGIWPA